MDVDSNMSKQEIGSPMFTCIDPSIKKVWDFGMYSLTFHVGDFKK